MEAMAEAYSCNADKVQMFCRPECLAENNNTNFVTQICSNLESLAMYLDM